MNIKFRTRSNSAHRVGNRLHGTLFSPSGQSLVELALMTPILLLLVIGTVEMGRYAYLSILVGNAAEAGAQYGAQSLISSADTPGITNAAQNDFQDGRGLGGLTLAPPPATICGCDTGGTTVTTSCTTGNPGTCAAGGHWVVSIQVTAKGTFTSLFNYPGIPATLTITRTATTRVKQ